MPDDKQLSRRDLLRGRVLGRAAEITSQAIESAAAPFANPQRPQPPTPEQPSRRLTLPIHRPPGAIDERSFLAGCTRCNQCMTACPVSAVVHAPPRFREAAGTPMIDAHVAACIMCTDTPCIAACKPGVLRLDQPRKMGVARIQPMACLAHSGSFCTVCSERCPVQGAIEVRDGRPYIREELCTGCGVCCAVCPSPTNAVLLLPLPDRPAPIDPPNKI